MEFFGDDSSNQNSGDDQAPDLVANFAGELEEGISNLEQKIVELETNTENIELINAIFRAFHNLKGSSGVVGFKVLPELMHFSESMFERVRSGKCKINADMVGLLLEVLGAMREIRAEIKASGKEGNKRYFTILAQLESMTTLAADIQDPNASADSAQQGKDENKKAEKTTEQEEYIKIARSLVDQLMLIVGDFMLVESAFQFMLKNYGSDWGFVENCQQLAHFSNKLQNTVLRMRLSPIKPVFSSMHRLVRNTAQETGKAASLEVNGADTLVDRSILDVISDPLVHMLRNSIDHGIENKEERIKLGKSPDGQVTLAAFHRSGEVVIQISDDGKGIDPARIKRKAIEKNFLTPQEAQNMSENELQNLIFLPGFSGADVVTNVSGRGVGMDVVKQTVEKLGGNVDLVSSPGNGTTISLRLPLSMAISECLEIRLGERSYAVPQVCIDEVFSMESPVIKQNIRKLNDGGRVLLLRDTPIPVLHLGEIFGIGHEIGDPHLIQVRYGNTKFAIEVGPIVGPCNIVCQPLPAVFAADAPFSGLTRRGDGSLMFQIDLGRLATKIHQQAEAKTPGGGAKMRGGTAITSSDLRRLQQKIAYFTNYEHFCVPVQGIKRIVSVSKSEIHLVDNRKYITLDGITIPLVWAEELLLKRPHIENDQYAVIIYQLEDKTFGLPMDKFHGIVRMPTQYDNTLRSDAITGTTVLEQNTVSVIDLFGLTSRVFGSEISVQNRKNVKVSKVIIAEDDPFFREQLIAFLKSREISAIAFPDGLATKEFMDDPANLEGVGAILSDVEMPRMDGLSLTRWIKGHESTKHLPVLIITSLTNKEVLRLAMSAGASSFIAKMHHHQVMNELKRIEAGLDAKEQGGQSGQMDGDFKTIQRRAVTFSLAGHCFAIPMDVLKEVSHISKNLPVPDCQPWIDRVTAFRGKMVPVIDLIRLFDFEEKKTPNELHQIIVDWNGNIVALLVDSIGEVVLMSQLTPGEGVGKANLKDLKIAPYLKGIFQKDSTIISLIDPAAIVNVHQQKGLIIQKKEAAA
jgi:two-component system chemotaxis sensor kinase CheA